VPADGRILEARNFFVNEALLTGKSYPTEKHASTEGIQSSTVAEASNAAFMGTSVISGSAKLFICATGKATQLGEISGTLRHSPPPSALEKGTYEFGMLIVRLTILLVLFVLLVNVLFHGPCLRVFFSPLRLPSGLLPNFLSMIVSVPLARGALRMARERAIVKRLAAVHDLGNMDVLCTDKTH
jgi:P-type Mg2+ transporter